MATIGSLVVNFLGNSRGLANETKRAESLMQDFGGRTQRILSGALAGAGFAFGAGSILQAAQTQIDAQRKLEATIAATGGAAGLSARQIAEYASELQSLTNFGDEVTISNAAILATFKEIKGDTFFDVLSVAQDLSVVMEQDLRSSVVQLGKAFNDPIKGASALTRVGVSFTQTQLDMIRSLQESGDLLGAQGVIMRELQSEFGGAAQALANPITQLKNTVGDLAETLGFILLPTVSGASQVLGVLVGHINTGAGDAQEFGFAIRGVGVGLAGLIAGYTAVRGALLAYAAAQRVAAAASVIAAGAISPAALAASVAGIAAATGAVYLLNQQFDAIGQSVPAIRTSIGDLGDEIQNLGKQSPVRQLLEDISPLLAELKRIEADVRPIQANLADALNARLVTQIDEAFDGVLDGVSETERKVYDLRAAISAVRDVSQELGEERANDLQARLEAEIGQLTGITREINRARDELSVLTGVQSQEAITLGKFADAGALPEQLDQLQQLFNQLDDARSQNEINEALAQQQEELQRLGDAITESLRTPGEVLADRVAELQELSQAGVISPETLARATEQAVGTFTDSLRNELAQDIGQPTQSAGTEASAALLRGSQEAFSAVLNAALSKGGKTNPNQKLEAEVAKQVELMKKQLGLLEQIASSGEAPIEVELPVTEVELV